MATQSPYFAGRSEIISARAYRDRIISARALGLRQEAAEMTEVRLGVLRGGRVACGCLRVEVEEEVTCRELIDQLTEEDGGLSRGEERGAWHLVERWNGCGEPAPVGTAISRGRQWLSTRRAEAGGRRQSRGGSETVGKSGTGEGVAQIW